MTIRAFRQVQIGQESTNGTPVATTRKFSGNILVNPEYTLYSPEDDNGRLSQFRRDVLVGQRVALRIEGGITYHDMIHILAAGVRGGVTPTGSSNDRTWVYTPLQTAQNNQDAYTIEYGDDNEQWEVPFATLLDFELGINLGDVLSINSNWIANAPSETNFTISTEPAVVEIVSNDLNIWIDSSWGNLGGTARTALLMGGTVRLETGLTPVKYADGSLNFSAIIEKKRSLEMTLEYAMGDNAMVEYDAWIAQTLRAIRLKWVGITTGGSLFYTLTIDVIGRYIRGPEIFGDRDGQDTMQFVFQSRTDGTNEFVFTVINNHADYIQN